MSGALLVKPKKPISITVPFYLAMGVLETSRVFMTHALAGGEPDEGKSRFVPVCINLLHAKIQQSVLAYLEGRDAAAAALVCPAWNASIKGLQSLNQNEHSSLQRGPNKSRDDVVRVMRDALELRRHTAKVGSV